VRGEEAALKYPGRRAGRLDIAHCYTDDGSNSGEYVTTGPQQRFKNMAADYSPCCCKSGQSEMECALANATTTATRACDNLKADHDADVEMIVTLTVSVHSNVD